MDEITILIGLGLILTGIIIGYPMGHIFGERHAHLCEDRREIRDILDAEVIQ